MCDIMAYILEILGKFHIYVKKLPELVVRFHIAVVQMRHKLRSFKKKALPNINNLQNMLSINII